jgi:AraC family transcriptional regulator of adaptative response/methylated-DNA-[protein]-cysteine methyltransferase
MLAPPPTLPSFAPSLTTQEMYDALVRRDEQFIGSFFVGVKSTGIFCRPGCPARVPNPEQCEFFSTAAQAMQSGYRACKRCAPTASFSNMPEWALALLERIDREPDRPITAAEVREAGVEPSRASRFFRSRLGSSIPALARARRVGLALTWIRAGKTVGAAAHRSGFSSESGFRKACLDLFGASPADAAASNVQPIVARWLDSRLGPILTCATDRGVCMLEFVDRRGLATQLETMRRRFSRPIVPGTNAPLDQLTQQLDAYITDGSQPFTVPIDAPGTAFQQRVWEALRAIPVGETRSYADIARAIGSPSAVRAVARANGDNRIAIIIPCHRVIGSDGSLTGYAGGLWRKRALLDHESASRPGRANDRQGSLFGV